MIPWSQVTVGAKNFNDILKDNPVRLSEIDTKKMRENIAKVAYQIVKDKGATNYGIAAVAARIIQAIIRDDNIVIPVSAMLNGEYGEEGVYAGVPSVITRQGVKELVTYHLTKDELNEFKNSINVLKSTNEKMLTLLS